MPTTSRTTQTNLNLSLREFISYSSDADRYYMTIQGISVMAGVSTTGIRYVFNPANQHPLIYRFEKFGVITPLPPITQDSLVPETAIPVILNYYANESTYCSKYTRKKCQGILRLISKMGLRTWLEFVLNKTAEPKNELLTVDVKDLTHEQRDVLLNLVTKELATQRQQIARLESMIESGLAN